MISFKNLSIKKLTLLIFLFLYIIYFLITSISLYSYSKYEFTRTKQLNEKSNEILSYQITDKVNSISEVSKYPLLAPELENIHLILREQTLDNIDNYNYLRKVCDMMLIQNSSINGAFIYDLSGNNVSSTRNSYSAETKNPYTEKWFTSSVSSLSGTMFFSDLTSDDIFVSPTKNDERLIGLTRQIIDFSNNKVTGILLLTISADKFQWLLSSNIQYDNQMLSIYDDSNKLIASSNENFSNDFSLSSLNFKDSVGTLTYNKNKYFLYESTISDLNWTIVNAIPNSTIYKSNFIYVLYFITNLIFFMILICILYVCFIKRIFNPILTLVKNMSSNNIENNLNQELSYNNNDELGLLFKSYNEMKSRISNLININYKTQIEQKELELKQLQNQINPHFIYNTLEAIHMMAEINGDLDTSKMAQYFGSIIRYSMNRKINTVTLEKELNIIDNYIYLQKIRFDQLFTIENNVPETLLQCEIIKMIIQPLIENSIYHGLSECSSEGKIIIQGEQIGDELLLTISDNGIGIDDDTLRDLNGYINDKNTKFKGIALRNINRRLKLKYGEQYGLEVFSVKGNGTSMVLTLPFIVK